METIKDIWWAVVVDEKINTVHSTSGGAHHEADIAQRTGANVKVERVRITIDRIKS